MIKIKDSVEDFFKWVKGSELVELDDIDVSEDPVRPELTLGFRITHGRKIFGLKYNDKRASEARLLLHTLFGHVSVVQVKRLLIN